MVWLRKIQAAARQLSYSGAFVYQQGNQMRTSRITHVFNGGHELEKLEILDGKPREYVRNNEEVVCYMPEAKTMLVEKRVTNDVFPAILAANPSDLNKTYLIRMGGAGRVAGRDCEEIVLEPRDRLRYGYRLWADRATGLLLKAQTLDDGHEIVEQISFAQVSIGDIAAGQARASYPDTAGWRVENAEMSQAESSGWSASWVPPGFRKIREVKRLVSDTASGKTESPEPRIVRQLVYSDGLAAISVFIEPGSQSRTEGSVQQGATNIIGKRQGDYWITLVGEVPAAALRQVANSIEFKPPSKPG